ncbi:MAG: sigma-54 dependent transcriptional regulator [Gracilibacteraceae bacterium]|jgi:DNA-binding NtrC family response regulator|nr:sigma-54 dependent transcriptional regulator [Gracilibacteraceae bacterium]
MPEKRRILVIDDEVDMLETMGRLLRRLGYEKTTLIDDTRVEEVLAELRPEIILTDWVMPKLNGLEVLRMARDMLPDSQVIIITGFATIESAVNAIKEGAFDYLSKPFTSDQLEVTIKRAEEKLDLKAENQSLRSQLKEKYDFSNIIGAGGGLRHIVEMIRKISASETNVLILGESGSGKELIARGIHANSTRRNGPFVDINCASLPNNLLESELFGHEKGAFTGAHTGKVGLMEVANRGTLFLDEIGEMSKELQTKLLKALEQRSFRRVGGTKEIHVDIRILAATNRDLEEAISQSEFREDLYYRLNVISIHLPPLRERVQDIPLLTFSFLRQFAEHVGKQLHSVAPDAMELLQHYAWPGNVRELKNVIERAVVLCETEAITAADLPERLHKKGRLSLQTVLSPDVPFHQAKNEWIEIFEVTYLQKLLEKHKGNISEAARSCGVDRKTIHRLVTRYSLK